MQRKYQYPTNYRELQLDSLLASAEDDEICCACELPEDILMSDDHADRLCQEVEIPQIEHIQLQHNPQVQADHLSAQVQIIPHEHLDTQAQVIPSSECEQEEVSSLHEIPLMQQSDHAQSGFGDISTPDINFQVLYESDWKNNNRFHTKSKTIKASISHNIDTANIDFLSIADAINNAYERFVSNAIADSSPDDYVSLTFRNPRDDRELFIHFKKKNFDKTEFLARAEKCAQSSGAFIDGGFLEISIKVLRNLVGMKRMSSLEPVEQLSAKRKSVVVIKNSDEYCGYYAIALGKFHADKTKDHSNEWCSLRRFHKKLKTLAAQLFSDLSIAIDGPMSIDKVNGIQSLLTEYQIIIVDSKTKLKLFAGPDASKKIILEYLDTPHFNLITSISGYMQYEDFCTRCWLKIRKDNHFCKDACRSCTSFPQCEIIAQVSCMKCRMEMKSMQCFKNHINAKVCGRKTKCKICWITHNVKEQHICDIYNCPNCMEKYSITPHYCFITPLSMASLIKQDHVPSMIVFYDIESMQQYQDTNKALHVPNLLISSTVCDKCFDFALMKRSDDCEICGVQYRKYYGETCIQKFCDYIYKEVSTKAYEANATVRIIAHNQKGYDGHFIIRDFFVREFQLVPEIIMQGSKLLFIKIENLRFIDSLSLLQQPLSALCKSFNILEMKKGFFPHYFNVPENQNYDGTLPSIEFYGANEMKPSMRKDFDAWYEQEKQLNKNFNFKKELEEYCLSDVNILTAAIMKFVSLFRSITMLNPITRRFTLASVAMETFRARLLQPKTLTITPIKGYTSNLQSISASVWLDYQRHILGSDYMILREFKIGPFYADGYEPHRRIAFEFYGCLFHGCPVCHPQQEEQCQMLGVTYGELYAKLLDKRFYYEKRGIQLVEIWEHEFNTMRLSPYIAERFQHRYSIKDVGPININESFFGGRTNNIKFYHKCKPNEIVKYVDFTSLYPFVLKNNPFPAGKPLLIEENFRTNITSYFGFVKCKVLPPKNLNIPVLPLKINKKLVFPLCRTCVMTNNMQDCEHEDIARMIINTWTTIELKTAVEYGYKIVKVYQVLQFNESTDLFSGYIDMWLKIKQESSGWPAWCITEIDQQNYIRNYEQHEGIKLDASSIENNPGKRSIAKLMLNSLWGKFAQNANLMKTTIVRTYADLYSLMNDETLDIHGVFEASPSVILVQHKVAEGHEENIKSSKANVAIASFVTAYARLELFKLIQRIESVREGRVIYFDTDSVVYIEKQGDPEIKCGDYLGQLTDEIGHGNHCDKFVTLGPKNYGYEVVKPDGSRKATIKVKGIKLTVNTLETITLERLCEMVEKYIEGHKISVTVKQTNITACKYTHKVHTNKFLKIYRAVSEKRRIVGNNTRPFGYAP